MKKNYVVDTNVLLHDPQAIFKFEDNDVVIPIFVIEEIDAFKRELSERGRSARTVSRYLDQFREEGGTLSTGVPLPGGGILRVALPRGALDLRAKDSRSQDSAILQVALDLKNSDQTKPTVFVTLDTNLRIRADALGLRAENFDSGRVVRDGGYTGTAELDVAGELVDQLHQPNAAVAPPDPKNLLPNQCVLLRDAAAPNHTALVRFDGRDGKLKPLRVPREGIWGIRPRNKEQTFALDLLLDDEIKLVTLIGRAGTGKTLLAIAAGLRRTVDDNIYARMLVSRPVFPLGKDIGYLPGDVEEKLNPWMKPIYDNLELIFNVGPAGMHGATPRPRGARGYEDLFQRGVLEVEPLVYIRGRSLPNQFLIVDEAQNLTPHEVKTVITRCGENTKIVLTGDPEQIDNPYVDAESNGLACVAERFKEHARAGHITLMRGERSELAELAADLL
jgi:PhoH-like ATPase